MPYIRKRLRAPLEGLVPPLCTVSRSRRIDVRRVAERLHDDRVEQSVEMECRPHDPVHVVVGQAYRYKARHNGLQPSRVSTSNPPRVQVLLHRATKRFVGGFIEPSSRRSRMFHEETTKPSAFQQRESLVREGFGSNADDTIDRECFGILLTECDHEIESRIGRANIVIEE